MMKKIIMYTQENAPLKVQYPTYTKTPTKQEAICDAIIGLADSIKARAIVAETASGAVAIELAARRPERSIIAVTHEQLVANQLAIVYGVKAYVRPIDAKATVKLTNWLRQSKVLAKGDMIVTVSGMHPGVVGSTDTIKVRLLE